MSVIEAIEQFSGSNPTVTSAKLNSMLHNILAGLEPRAIVAKRNSSNPTTQWDLNADLIPLYASGGEIAIAEDVDLTIDFTTVGAGGLDAGSVAANSWYYIYTIAKDANSDGVAEDVAGVASLSATAPTLPAGYTHKWLDSAARTDGSGHLIDLVQFDNVFLWGERRQIVYGSATVARTALSLADYMPALSILSLLELSLAVGSTGDMDAHIYTTGTTNALIYVEGENGDNTTSGERRAPASARSVDYDVTLVSGSGYYFVHSLGFEMDIKARR